jgi:hypothetical protein
MNNPLKTTSRCPSHFNNLQNCILYLWVNVVLTVNRIISLNGANQLIFVMVKFGVLFEVRTELLYIT